MTTMQQNDLSSLTDVTASVARFLRQQLRSGTYSLACVGEDGRPTFADNKGHIFVASFIVEAMAGLLDEIDRTIVLVRALSEEMDGCWGYSPPGVRHMEQWREFDVDADDTAYVIRTLRLLGVNRPPNCLTKFYRETSRLFVTWDTAAATRPGLTTDMSFANNCLAHLEVNANVFLALQGTHLDHLINYDMLIETQNERGYWQSYFYPSPLYATLLVLDLLADNPAFAAAAARALVFIAQSQNVDGSWGDNGDPYETALAVAGLARYRAHPESVRRGLDYLLTTVSSDGSWASPSVVWACPREAEVWRSYDTQRTFISACCLRAIRRASDHLARSP